MLKNLHHYNFFSFSKGKYDFVRAINFYQKTSIQKPWRKKFHKFQLNLI